LNSKKKAINYYLKYIKTINKSYIIFVLMDINIVLIGAIGNRDIDVVFVGILFIDLVKLLQIGREVFLVNPIVTFG